MTATVPPIVSDVLRSSGQPLDAATRGYMEPRFGHDFSKVRVHADGKAADAAAAINARAFTSGQGIAFGAGQYMPQIDSGRRLIAHELTHVVQQRSGVRVDDGIGRVGDANERQADSVSDQVMKSQLTERLLDFKSRSSGADAGTREASGSIQRQHDPSKPVEAKTDPDKAKKTDKPTKPSLSEAVVTPKDMTADQIIKMLKVYKGKLLSVTTSKEQEQTFKVIRGLTVLLKSVPISPIPKRNFIGGPIKFGPYDKNHYSFGFQSMQDKHWRDGWKAIYTLAAGPLGIVISICDAALSESGNDRFFDQEANEQQSKGRSQKVAEEVGKDLPSKYLDYGLEKPMDWFFKQSGTEAAEVVGKTAGKLAVAIDVALAAYEIYKANTDGPSLTMAAVETTARIMGRAFNMARGINMNRGQGGEFVLHGDASSEVRVAHNPLDHVPLEHMKDRRLAYDMVGNRVYEMMMNVLTPNDLKSADDFYVFRDKRIANAGNIVENAGATIVEKSEKLGGWMLLETEQMVDGVKSYGVTGGKVR